MCVCVWFFFFRALGILLYKTAEHFTFCFHFRSAISNISDGNWFLLYFLCDWLCFFLFGIYVYMYEWMWRPRNECGTHEIKRLFGKTFYAWCVRIHTWRVRYTRILYVYIYVNNGWRWLRMNIVDVWGRRHIHIWLFI